MYFLDFGGGWPGSSAIKFYWVYGKLTEFHDHSKVFDFRDVKLAFFELQVKIKLGHLLKDIMSLFSMSLWVWGGDEEVIHIDDKPSFSDHVLE